MEAFIEISIILAVTVLVAAIMRLLRQPLIIGYILSGILVSPYFFNVVKSADTIAVFSQMGVAFLLFIVGISLSPRVIKEVGKVSLITGLGQIIFTSLIGFFVCKLLGFSTIVSLYVAIAITFSSTIIIMKLLSDKKDTERLYGKISMGFLLVQDIVAIVLLMIISSLSSGLQLTQLSMQSLSIGVFLIAGFILVSVFILPKLSVFFAKSQEFLFLFSIAWGIGLAALFDSIGFSLEIGALIAGIALSMSPFNYEITAKLRPLRDFFIILFFVLLGSQMTFGSLSDIMVPALVLSLFILIGNPLIVMTLMGFLGYRKKTGFQAGFTVAQISEFSLILIALGVSVGHLSTQVLSLVTIVGLITISGSTYLIMYSDKLYPFFSRYLSIFERKKAKKEKDSVGYDIIQFGYNRIGYDLVKSFKKLGSKHLIVDYDPDTILELSHKGVACRYGDADDEDFLDELQLSSAKMVISTIPKFDTNTLLINQIRRVNKNAIIIVISHSINETIELYKLGASYVIMPHFLGGNHASKMIDEFQFDSKMFRKEKEKHRRYLHRKKKLGHDKPRRHRSRHE